MEMPKTTIRLSATEKKMFQKAAGKTGMKLAAWLRFAARELIKRESDKG